jgi:hypothetical protein
LSIVLATSSLFSIGGLFDVCGLHQQITCRQFQCRLGLTA